MQGVLQNPTVKRPPVRPDVRILPKKRYNKKAEENLQIRVANYLKKCYPDVIFNSDFAAGLELRDNQRITLSKVRSEGAHPDMFIMERRRGFAGLCLELKKEGFVVFKKDGSLRKSPYKRKYRRYGKTLIVRGDHLQEQQHMLDRLTAKGYYARFVVGYDQAVQMIDWYMQKPKNEELF